METCPKGNFISISHLPVPVKVHKENIKTKRETTGASSEPCETSKVKPFAKIRKGFQLLLSLLSELLYTEAYSEPSQISKMELFAKILKNF